MSELGRLVVSIAANTAQFSSDMGKAARVAQQTSSSMERVFSSAGTAIKASLAGIGFAEIAGRALSAIGAINRAVGEAESAQQRLNAVYRATGGAVGVARSELEEMAEAMAKSTTFDDESIRNAQAELVKFGNIHGDVFRQALNLSADVAAFLGEDIPSAAAKLGKSLVDPESAFGLLKRAGVALTDEQKEMIKTFSDMGETAKAQQLILEQLQKTFGGTANEMNTGITAATKNLDKSWDELLETLGKTSGVSQSTSAMMRLLGRQVDYVTDSIGKLATSKGNLQQSLADGNLPLLKDRQIPGAPTIQHLDIGAAEQVRRAKEMRESEDKAAVEAYRKKQEMIKNADKYAAERQKLYDANRAQEARNRQADFNSEWSNIDGEMDRIQAKRDELEDLRKKWVDLVDPVEKYRRELDELDKLEANGFDPAKVVEGRLKIHEAIDELGKGNEKLKESNNLARDLGLVFTSSFEQALTGGGKMRDVLQGLAQDIFKLLIRKYITQPILEAVDASHSLGEVWDKLIGQMSSGGGGGGGGGGFGGLFNSIGSWFGDSNAGFDTFNSGSAAFSSMDFGDISAFSTAFANGGIMTSRGRMPLRKYASGGVARTPQVAMFGEGSSNEAFVPLPDGNRIPVELRGTMGGGGDSYTFVYNINAQGAQKGVDQDIRRMLRESEDKAVDRAVQTVQDRNQRGALRLS